MKKVNLGIIPYPERYCPIGEDCLIENSIKAYDFFKDFYTPHGLVVLGKVIFASLAHGAVLVWIYVDIKKQEILSLLPIFRSDFENTQSAKILSVDFFEHEIFFLKDYELYSSVFTSTGQTSLLKVRSLPELNEFYEALKLGGQDKIKELYPVKVYNLVDSRFLATCWAYTTEEDDALYLKPVCIDDIEKFDHVDIDKTEVFPIDLGETAVIGGEHYILRYTKEKGTYFDKAFSAENKTFKTRKKDLKQTKPLIVKMSPRK